MCLAVGTLWAHCDSFVSRYFPFCLASCNKFLCFSLFCFVFVVSLYLALLATKIFTFLPFLLCSIALQCALRFVFGAHFFFVSLSTSFPLCCDSFFIRICVWVCYTFLCSIIIIILVESMDFYLLFRQFICWMPFLLLVLFFMLFALHCCCRWCSLFLFKPNLQSCENISLNGVLFTGYTEFARHSFFFFFVAASLSVCEYKNRVAASPAEKSEWIRKRDGTKREKYGAVYCEWMANAMATSRTRAHEMSQESSSRHNQLIK